MNDKIRICRTSTTMQHYTREGLPFTISVHSTAILVGNSVRAVGLAETPAEAFAEGVRQFRMRTHGYRARTATQDPHIAF